MLRSYAKRTKRADTSAPADGVVSVIVAEIGEKVRAGQSVLVIAETGKQFLSLNTREDRCTASRSAQASMCGGQARRRRRKL